MTEIHLNYLTAVDRPTEPPGVRTGLQGLTEKPDKPHFDLNANVGDQWCSSKHFIKCGNIFSYHSSGGGVLLVCDGVDDIHPEMHRQPHPSTKKNHLALKVNPAIAEKPCVCENLM